MAAIKLGPSTRLLLPAAAVLALAGFFGARLVRGGAARPGSRPPASAPAASSAPTAELRVPHLVGGISLDGDLDDSAWRGPVARTGAFLASNGAPAKPYSDARLVWGDGHLYLALYAADEDVRAAKRSHDDPVYLDDSFHFELASGDATYAFDVNALGVATDAMKKSGGAFDYAWESGIHVSKELDGTLNDPSDDDEEWALEIAIPLESLGLEGKSGERIAFTVRRCDTPKHVPRSCATWPAVDARGEIVLE